MELIQQYTIVLVSLDPTLGSEINKTRPCVVISPNELNKHLRTIVIAPITSTSKSYPTRIPISGKITKGWIVVDQIRVIDRRRVIKSFGNLKEEEIIALKAVIKETYVD
ncbi:type II toxin-antitoxin system PemK/MazF family toxin [Kaistella polysaccharea]|uniref:type II toxin-antitoxin system PemK/MazF family toxin n=1 Tax=Kaistella polysaccharea TaxID=2878534 RepID=UPI001CF4873C|nr:type II toxin-antitoxin system PemK/MazF family toxin [Kaistella polysaccharea]